MQSPEPMAESECKAYIYTEFEPVNVGAWEMQEHEGEVLWVREGVIAAPCWIIHRPGLFIVFLPGVISARENKAWISVQICACVTSPMHPQPIQTAPLPWDRDADSHFAENMYGSILGFAKHPVKWAVLIRTITEHCSLSQRQTSMWNTSRAFPASSPLFSQHFHLHYGTQKAWALTSTRFSHCSL